MKPLEPQAEEPPAEHGERHAEHDRAAAVGAEPVVRHHEEAEQPEEEEAERAEAASREHGPGK